MKNGGERGATSTSVADIRLKVATFVFGFPPGFRGGGPLVSVPRTLDSSPHEHLVITRDRDLGDSGPYSFVTRRTWLVSGGLRIHYTNKTVASTIWWILDLRRAHPDIVFVNSLHGRYFALLPVLLCKIRVLRPRILLVCTHGECTPGALRLKAVKKRIGRPFIRAMHPKHTVWQATNPAEATDILQWIGSSRRQPPRILVHSNPGVPPRRLVSEGSGGFELVISFVSRIHPKKGLIEAIACISRLDFSCHFQVWGTIEDSRYWSRCETALADLPESVTVSVHGAFRPEQRDSIYASSDVLLFPTLGENFGYVIPEALSVGCPVVTTPYTPWADSISGAMGFVCTSIDEMVAALTSLARMPPAERRSQRNECWEGYVHHYESHQAESDDLFEAALRKSDASFGSQEP